MDQLGGGANVFALQLPFHEVPHVFDGIQIRTVPRPVNDLKWLTTKEIPDPLGGVAGDHVLQEVGGSEVVHREQQVVLENLLVPFAVHGGILLQKVNTTSSHSRKAPPHHNGIRVLHNLRHVAGVEAVGSTGPPHLGLDGPDAPECGLVAKHDISPILFSPGFVRPTESQPLLLHLQGKQRLLDSGPSRHAKRHLQVALDISLTDGRELWEGFLQISCCHCRVFPYMSL